MADPVGMVNGLIDSPLAVSTTMGGPYTLVCGVTSSSDAFNTALSETTNNCSEQFRTYLDGAGTKSLDVSVESNYSADPGFQIIFMAAVNNTPVYCQRTIGTAFTLTFKANVPSATLTYPLSEKVTSSITLNSNGNYVLAPV